MCVLRGAWLQPRREAATLHAERWEQLVYGVRQASGALGPRGSEGGAGPRELRRGGRAREPARVDRLLELARQAPQLIGMGKALRLDVQRLHLPRPGCGLLDFLDDMAQVVRFAAHLLAGGRELLLAPLELMQAVVGIPHRGAFDDRVRVAVEDIALGISAEQGLRLVLTVEVHQQSAKLRQDTHGRGTAVDPGAGAPLRRDLALENQTPVLQLHAQAGEGWWRTLEDGGGEVKGSLDHGS